MDKAPLSQTPTEISMPIGRQFTCKEEEYVILQSISPPIQCYHYHRETTQDGVVISHGDYYAFEESYWIQNLKSGIVYLCVIRYEYKSNGIPMKRMVAKFNEFEGDAREPEGFRVYILRSLGTIKGRADHHRCYIWEAERSLDHIGEVAKREQLRTQYVKEHTPHGTVLTLESGESYRIESLIAADGTFGTVLKAKRLRDGQTVAIKMQALGPAQQEANVLQVLSHHPFVVDLLDVGRVTSYQGIQPTQENPFLESVPIMEDGQIREQIQFICLVVEFIRGKTIETIVSEQGAKTASKKRGLFEIAGLPIPQTISITEQLCDVVDYIHNEGFLHADIKPQNVMLDKDGMVRVVDMGSVSPKGQNLYAMGIGPHAAPEIKEYYLNSSKARQLRNLASSPKFSTTTTQQQILDILSQARTCQSVSEQAYQTISEGTDIFSVGAIFFSLLIGRHPRQMSGERIQDPRKKDILTLEPIRVERVLIDRRYFSGKRKYFQDVVTKALSVKSEDRYLSGQDLKRDIRYGFSRLVRDDFVLSALLALGAILLCLLIITHLTVADLLTPGLIVATLIGGWWVLERSPLNDTGIRIYEYLTKGSRIIARTAIAAIVLTFLAAWALNVYSQNRLEKTNTMLKEAIVLHEQALELEKDVESIDRVLSQYEEAIERYDWIINFGYPFKDQSTPRQAREKISVAAWNSFLIFHERDDLLNAFDMLLLSNQISSSVEKRRALFEMGYLASLDNDDSLARDCFKEYLKSIPIIPIPTIEEFGVDLVQTLVEIVNNDPQDQKASELVFMLTYIEPYRRLIVTGNFAQLMASPDRESEVTAILDTNTQIAILSETSSVNGDKSGRWYQVWVNGQIGYVFVQNSE